MQTVAKTELTHHSKAEALTTAEVTSHTIIEVPSTGDMYNTLLPDSINN